jgi:hypothetical protein
MNAFLNSQCMNILRGLLLALSDLPPRDGFLNRERIGLVLERLRNLSQFLLEPDLKLC